MEERGHVGEERGADEGRLWLHFAFGAAYAVLLLRFLPFLVSVPADGWLLQLSKVAADMFAGHFGSSRVLFDDDPRMVIPDIVMACVAYGATHYAAASRLPEDEGDSRMLKFMYFCRSLLYLFVTLLVMLVIVRMFILVYQDLSWGRSGVLRVIGTPPR